MSREKLQYRNAKDVCEVINNLFGENLHLSISINTLRSKPLGQNRLYHGSGPGPHIYSHDHTQPHVTLPATA